MPLYPDGRIEFTWQVLKGNQSRQFDDGIIVEMSMEALEILRTRLLVRVGDGFRIGERGLLPLRIQLARLEIGELCKFRFVNTTFDQRALRTSDMGHAVKAITLC